MGKNDFDIDFDFDEEYGFDPKAFLGAEEYEKNMDPDAFTDEELGADDLKQFLYENAIQGMAIYQDTEQAIGTNAKAPTRKLKL